MWLSVCSFLWSVILGSSCRPLRQVEVKKQQPWFMRLVGSMFVNEHQWLLHTAKLDLGPEIQVNKSQMAGIYLHYWLDAHYFGKCVLQQRHSSKCIDFSHQETEQTAHFYDFFKQCWAVLWGLCMRTFSAFLTYWLYVGLRTGCARPLGLSAIIELGQLDVFQTPNYTFQLWFTENSWCLQESAFC